MHAADMLLRALNAENHVTLQTLRRGKPQRARYDVPLYQNLHRLEVLNQEGSDVYFSVNQTNDTGRTSKHVTTIRAVWGDYDHGIPASWWTEPTAVVESSPSKFQVYWALDTPISLEEPGSEAHWQSVQDRWVWATKADWAARDLARILRLPGFINHKYAPPVRAELRECSGKRYSIGYLEGFVHDVKLPECTTYQALSRSDAQNIGQSTQRYLPLPSVRRRRFGFYLARMTKVPPRGHGLTNAWYYRLACKAVVDFAVLAEDAADALAEHSARHHGQDAYEYNDMLALAQRARAYGKGFLGSAYAGDRPWTIKEG